MEKTPRRPFPQSALAAAPFQLLPHARYDAAVHEKRLRWQEQFADSCQARFPTLTVLAANGQENLVQDALDVQSYRGFEAQILESSSFVDAILEHQQSLNELVVIVPAGVTLHPQALFVIAKEFAQTQAEFCYWNSVIVESSLGNPLAFVRREPMTTDHGRVSNRYSLFSHNPFGIAFAAERSFLLDVIRGIRSAKVPLQNQELSWLIGAASLIGMRRIQHIPLALDLSAPAERAKGSPEPEFLKTLASWAGLSFASFEPQMTEIGAAYLPRPMPAAGRMQVVIPFRDQIPLTLECLRSLLTQSIAVDLDVTLVDNNSQAEGLRELDAFMKATTLPTGMTLEVVHDPEYFNFARVNNVGLARSTAPFALLLNNDVVLDSQQTLEELRAWCAMPEVGCVGGLLCYPDGRVQHAGIGFWSVRPANLAQPLHFTEVVRELNAVTFAMACFRREALASTNGLDEFLCPNGFGDALLCLELEKHGWRTIYTPRATGIHHESASRGATPEELELYEMVRSGLPIADLYADMSAEKQPTIVPLAGPSAQPLVTLAKRVLRSPRMNALAAKIIGR